MTAQLSDSMVASLVPATDFLELDTMRSELIAEGRDSKMSFSLEMDVEWEGNLYCAVDVGGYSTLKDALDFANWAYGRSVRTILDTSHRSFIVDLPSTEAKDQPVLGVTVQGYTDAEGTVWQTYLQWPNVV